MATFPPPPPTAAPPQPARRGWRLALAAAALMLMIAAAVGAGVLAPRVHRIEGHSMDPALRNDDRTIFVRLLGDIARADIVTYRYPRNPAKMFSGRIVGLPGERLAIVGGVVHVDGRPLDEPYLAGVPRPPQTLPEIRLGPDEYYVLGDNRGNSSDSREWGPVARRLIGKRLWRVWWRNPSRVLAPRSAGGASR